MTSNKIYRVYISRGVPTLKTYTIVTDVPGCKPQDGCNALIKDSHGGIFSAKLSGYQDTPLDAWRTARDEAFEAKALWSKQYEQANAAYLGCIEGVRNAISD
ncbi:MAG: hypothetical protein GY759_09000 [Chloroflexi bacterium]|nr:hypothetical protein [Chloroflexota bacterium]